MKEAALKLAFIRFLRTVIPQIPAMVAFVQSTIDPTTVPGFVPPTLVLLGAIATAVDKFARELGLYTEIKNVFTGK
jgi:hypothetical protein